tara:strand:- start:125 stop:913 length:789 start_codon:yes stop_codon:yes gene_type:complete
MLTNIFKPKHEYDLIRLGGNYDGGYLVERSSIEKSKSLVTLGLGYEWTFEKDYYKLYRKPIHCYDHTVSYSSIKKLSRKALASNFFRLLKPKYFTKKNFLSNLKKSVFLYKDYKNLFQNEVKHYVLRVGPGFGPGNKGILLSEILKKIQKLPCFLKVDIEAAEYRILDEIIQLQDNFIGLAIEFHDVDLHLKKIENFIKSLNMTLVHIHPMNQALVVNNIPIQIELTFAKNPVKINENYKIPHHLDMPGNPSFKEIDLKFQD